MYNECATVRLMFILQCIIGLQSQSTDFTDPFYQEDIISGEPVLIKLTGNFKSDRGQYDVVIRLKKRLYGQAEAARI